MYKTGIYRYFVFTDKLPVVIRWEVPGQYCEEKYVNKTMHMLMLMLGFPVQ